jgi:hypothetical protein
VEHDVEVEALAEDVGAQVALLVRLTYCPLELERRVQELPAAIDERGAAADGVSRDRHPLHQLVRIALEQLPVLEGPRLPFVRVADHVDRLLSALRDEVPLHAGGEPRAASPP